jgi:hypothetical protein
LTQKAEAQPGQTRQLNLVESYRLECDRLERQRQKQLKQLDQPDRPDQPGMGDEGGQRS